MASQIDTIYTNLKARPATHDSDVTVKVFKYDELPEGDLPGNPNKPTRLLRYVSGDGTLGAQPFAFLGLGPGATITWFISDTLYMKPVADGGGHIEAEPDLVKYSISYLNEIYQDAGIASQSEITNVTVAPGVYNYPDDAIGTPFFGVRCIVEVNEHLVGAQST